MTNRCNPLACIHRSSWSVSVYRLILLPVIMIGDWLVKILIGVSLIWADVLGKRFLPPSQWKIWLGSVRELKTISSCHDITVYPSKGARVVWRRGGAFRQGLTPLITWMKAKTSDAVEWWRGRDWHTSRAVYSVLITTVWQDGNTQRVRAGASQWGDA